MKLALLNTSIITNDGDYSLRPISLEKARHCVKEAEAIDSAIGHESTSKIMSELLGVNVPVNRQNFSQQVGQKALVFKLNERSQEGKILTRKEVEEIGYSFKLLVRHS